MYKDFEHISCKLEEVVRCARTGDYSDGASKLNTCLQELQPILTSGKIPVDYIKKLTYSMETILLMQIQKDWVAVADVIEYEFIALLKQAVDTIKNV